jgi:hypothetical protein
MRHFVTFFVAPLLVTTFAAGCSSQSLSPSSPSAGGGATTLTADQIAGTWRLASIQPAGETEQVVPAGALYDLALTDPLLACTRAACPTMAFESTYVGILAGESATRTDGSSLALSSPRGVLRFRR